MDTTVILKIPGGVFFHKGQGFCFVCDVALTSLPLKKQHEEGRKHRNQVNQKFGSGGGSRDSGQVDNMMMCSICKVSLIGDLSVRRHLTDASHIQRIRGNEYQAVTVPSGMSMAGTSVAAQPPILSELQSNPRLDTELQKPAQVPEQQHAAVASVGELENSFRAVRLEDSSLDLGATSVTQDAMLNVLDEVPRPSQNNMILNISPSDAGENNEMIGLNIPPSDIGEVKQNPEASTHKYPLSCNLCNKTFTGSASAAEHFTSANHMKTATNAELVATGNGEVDPETGALKIEYEGSVCYICKVCVCRRNSQNEYMQHVESRQHKDAITRSSLQEPRNQSFADLPNAQESCNFMPEVSSMDIGATGLGGTESGTTTMKKYDIDRSVSEPGSSTGVAAAVHLSNVARDEILSSPSLASTGESRGSQGGNAASKFSHHNPEAAINRTSQTCGSMIRQRSEGHGQSHSGFGADGNSFTDLPQNFAVYQRSQSSSGGHSRSAGQSVRLDGDYEPDTYDVKHLPTSCSLEEYQDQASQSLHNNLSADVEYEESKASTTSNNETSVHPEPDSFLEKKILNTASVPAFVEEEQPQTPTSLTGFRYECTLCRRGMNTRKDLKIHKQGSEHMMKSATVCAPDISKEPLIKREDEKDDLIGEMYSSCKTTPRTYQIELLCKTMDSDSTVVFLPTGTGKTLIALMTIRRMLTLNKTRPVLFLTDKVLLVLQQARNIIRELGDDLFDRPSLTNDGTMEKRQLKVAALCGGLNVRDDTPLWKYDVVVITAAYCENLLQQKKALQWANFSLVVFDEAHHCTKRHPYKRLLDKYHLSIASVPQRPKVLGLTASPTGRSTRDTTLAMLKTLLQNLGDATVAAIDEKSNVTAQMLESFSSNAKLVMMFVPMTETEQEFQTRLLSYFVKAYKQLMQYSNLRQICSAEDLKNIASDQIEGSDELNKLLQLAHSDGIKALDDKQKFTVIQAHVKAVGDALLQSEDGINFVLEDLEHIFNESYNQYLSVLSHMGLACEDINKYISSLSDSLKLRTVEEASERPEGAVLHMSIFQKLLETLADTEYIAWENPNSMALVLVQEREKAFKFEHHLKASAFVRQNGIHVEGLVGHGAGSGEVGGMKLGKQDKVLRSIQSQDHGKKIVVATSVLEEGIDIPKCQLVICLNPPTTVKAMVQMRGRARKKNSYFVVLWRNQKDREKLEDLQLQEENMKWAVSQLL